MATKSKSQDKGVTQCPAGTVLFREGEPGNKLYVIKSGRVRLSKRVFDADVVVEELRAGDFCGEIALLNDQPRPVTATAFTDAGVIQMDANQFENMIRSNADIAVRMMKKMAARLTESQFRLSNFALRTNKARVLGQLRHEAARKADDLSKPAPIPDDLAAALVLEVGEVKLILGELVRDQLITIDKRGIFTVVDAAAFDRYLRFLELRDHFEYRDGS